MRTAIVAALLLSLVAAAPPAHADQFLADFTGYDWLWPNTTCLDCPGQWYEAQGYVNTVNAAFLTFDFTNNQYTFVLGNTLIFSSADTFGTTIVAHYLGGNMCFYGDPKVGGTPAVFNSGGRCSPFTDRPAFADGDSVLCGDFSSFDIVFDTTTTSGNLVGVIDWNRGSQLGNIPPAMRHGWTFGAIGFRPGTVPCGYHWQVDGECYLQQPVPVKSSTWGEVKTMFAPGVRH